MKLQEQDKTVGDAGQPSLLTSYDELLTKYEKVLSGLEINPYQSQFMLLVKSFNPLFQWKLWSSYFRDFLGVPNALKLDLAGADKLLPELWELSIDTLEGLKVVNDINSRRLRRRSAFGWASKIGIGLGALLGLFSALDKFLPQGLERLVPAFVFELLVYILFGAVVGIVLNIMMAASPIGLVQAFGDILEISLASRGEERRISAKHPKESLQPTQ